MIGGFLGPKIAMDRSGWSRADYGAWAMQHLDKVKICAEESFVKCGRGVVTLLFKGDDVHITSIPAAQVPLHGVGKFVCLRPLRRVEAKLSGWPRDVGLSLALRNVRKVWCDVHENSSRHPFERFEA